MKDCITCCQVGLDPKVAAEARRIAEAVDAASSGGCCPANHGNADAARMAAIYSLAHRVTCVAQNSRAEVNAEALSQLTRLQAEACQLTGEHLT